MGEALDRGFRTCGLRQVRRRGEHRDANTKRISTLAHKSYIPQDLRQGDYFREAKTMPNATGESKSTMTDA
jgi:hypothetical protein